MEEDKGELRETTEEERGWWPGPGGSCGGEAKLIVSRDAQVVQVVGMSGRIH